MARNRRSRFDTGYGLPSLVALERLVSRSAPLISPVVLRPAVTALEDRRTFYPLGRSLRPAAALTRGARQVVAKAAPPFFVYPSARVGFAAPAAVSICVRRHVRREALFGLNRVGSGKRVSNRRRRSRFSDVDC